MTRSSISDTLFFTVALIRRLLHEGDQVAHRDADAGFSAQDNPTFPREALEAELDAMDRLARQILAAGEDNVSKYHN